MAYESIRKETYTSSNAAATDSVEPRITQVVEDCFRCHAPPCKRLRWQHWIVAGLDVRRGWVASGGKQQQGLLVFLAGIAVWLAAHHQRHQTHCSTQEHASSSQQ